MSEYALIDENTGEKVDLPFVVLSPGDRVLRKKQTEGYIQKKIRNEAYKKYGSFTLMFYEPLKPLPFNLSDSDLIKLIYLGTYLSYDGYLVNDKNVLNKQDCMKLINLESKSQFYKFWNSLIENDIVIMDDKRICINPKYFNVGKFIEPPTNSHRVIRLNRTTIKQLYENKNLVSNTQKFGYIFKIIPWINYKWNIVCSNPMEENRYKLDYIKLSTFADLVGYSRKHIRSLSNYLSSILITDFDYNKKSAFYYTIDGQYTEGKRYIAINPTLCYGGNNFQQAYQTSFRRDIYDLRQNPTN